jgi:hypothetical protein
VCSIKPVQREKVLLDDKPKGSLQPGETTLEVPFRGLETSLSHNRGAACCGRSRNALEKRTMPTRHRLQMSAKKNLRNSVKIPPDPLVPESKGRNIQLNTSMLSPPRFSSPSRYKLSAEESPNSSSMGGCRRQEVVCCSQYAMQYTLCFQIGVENSYSGVVRRGMSCLTLAFTESVVIRFPAPRTDLCGLPKQSPSPPFFP